MKALSLSQPWLWAVELFASDPAGKGIENRSWPPPISMIGQRIALHAAQSWDDDAAGMFFRQLRDRQDLLGRMPGARARYAKSVITCTVIIDRVVTESRTLSDLQRGWFFGPYGWVLRDVRVLAEPIACSGNRKLWTLPEGLESVILGQGAA